MNEAKVPEPETNKDLELKTTETELEKFYNGIQEDVKKGRKDSQQEQETRKCIDNLKSELQEKFKKDNWKETLDAYREEHKFLSQQIDERMHQMWTLGALFVPISFLIFAEAVVYSVTLFGKLLVAIASLVCYEVWYRIYLRSRAMTKLSYPRIHVLEHVLYRQRSEQSNFHGHMHLDYVTDKYEIRASPPKFFKWARRILVGLWIVYLMPDLLSLAISLKAWMVTF